LSALTPVSDSPLFPYTTLFRSLCPRLLEHPVEVQPVELPVRLLNELEELDRVARRDERARVTDEAGVEAPHVARKGGVGGVAVGRLPRPVGRVVVPESLRRLGARHYERARRAVDHALDPERHAVAEPLGIEASGGGALQGLEREDLDARAKDARE